MNESRPNWAKNKTGGFSSYAINPAQKFPEDVMKAFREFRKYLDKQPKPVMLARLRYMDD